MFNRWICRELNENQLTGYIPPELGKLTDLFDLYVSLLHVSFYIKIMFCFCFRWFTSNNFVFTYTGTLQTTSLKVLYLIIWVLVKIWIACKIIFRLFFYLLSLFTIICLYLCPFFSNVHGNKLNGTIPRSFKKLESMTYL